jgi:hypothetical protein
MRGGLDVKNMSSDSSYADLIDRVAPDHVFAELNTLTEKMYVGGSDAAQLNRLKGATIDELVRHSKGCAIAQVLMATGFIHVETLHVQGGDAAVADVDSLKSEITGPQRHYRAAPPTPLVIAWAYFRTRLVPAI